MEKNQARPLAYNLAKELNHKVLDEVSGGRGRFPLCMEPTNFTTNQSTVDTTLDFNVDY